VLSFGYSQHLNSHHQQVLVPIDKLEDKALTRATTTDSNLHQQ